MPFETDTNQALRRMRRDNEDAQITVVGYIKPDGSVEPLKGDEAGAYVQDIGTTLGTDRYSSSALERRAVVKDSNGVMLGGDFLNGSGNTRFLQLFDRTTVPSAGAVPIAVYHLLANGSVHVARQIQFEQGIVWAISTTAATYTDPGAVTEVFAMVLFR